MVSEDIKTEKRKNRKTKRYYVFHFFCFFVFWLSVSIFFSPIILLAHPSVDVPLRHWSYDAIEKLAILNLCDIADIGARPVSRIKMAHIIKSAIEKSREYELDFDWDEQEYLEMLLYNLIYEFREEQIGRAHV